MDAHRIRLEVSSLSVLAGLKSNQTIKKISVMLEAFDKSCEAFVQAYSALVLYMLQTGGLTKALTEDILFDANLFAKQSQTMPFEEIGDTLKNAVEHDVKVLNHLLSCLFPQEILQAAAKKYPDDKEYILSLPCFEPGEDFKIGSARALYEFYHKNGYGFFARHDVCIYKDKKISAVKSPDPVRLSDLKGYRRQKETIVKNTKLFLKGKPANNVLLYGDKGTGKSSTVKAILNEFKGEGLRLIEIRKEDLADFYQLCEILAESPFSFIVFLDDIGFAKEDDSFGTLKAVIEGGIVRRPDNVIIYATSNRRHLVGENFSDREGDDIHVRDTIETITSLSDRFGIEVVFGAPEKDEYLMIVEELAKEEGISMEPEELYMLAERFALLKSGRSPRTARQFITSLLARQ